MVKKDCPNNGEHVFKHLKSTREELRFDLGAFILAHSTNEDALMYKRTTFCENVRRERFVFDENDIMKPWTEFIVETEFFYWKTEVTFWDTSTFVKKHFTEY